MLWYKIPLCHMDIFATELCVLKGYLTRYLLVLYRFFGTILHGIFRIFDTIGLRALPIFRYNSFTYYSDIRHERLDIATIFERNILQYCMDISAR